MTSGTAQANSAKPRNIFEAAWLGTKTTLTALRIKGREWGRQAATLVKETASKEKINE